ncbi:V-type proton ATPase subunit G 2-like [Lethenteron reissneri]|uniref:V-type proton ATPase subunit G 2-like n=1 Tax=Lethenteron reissneri TaxID=7753 RepID=UPI002AB6E8CA|nr:V-type proton ATPase subunit G 2-like [Lethenteron reissneri]
MTSQSQGIQQLLQAEKRASEKVSEARKRKTRRLKQAKEEAQAEIDQYRLQRENEFRKKQDSIMGSQGNMSTKIDEDTRTRIQTVRGNYQTNKEMVLKQLLAIISDIKPEIHQNYHS